MLIFALWAIVTLLVIIFLLIDRWQHPHMKGISHTDLLTYLHFSIVQLQLCGVCWFITGAMRKWS